MNFLPNKIFYPTAIAITAVACLGYVHIVYGSSNDGISIERKLSWSLSETVINKDSLLVLPAFVARSQYPLYLAKIATMQQQTNVAAVTPYKVSLLYYKQPIDEAENLIGKPDKSFSVGNENEIIRIYSNRITGQSVTITYLHDKISKIEKD